ncbi:tetratricopeptide repeat protein [Reichenbachiella ulvae]|uniref:histidine kinase n=1 Tax=Reichenbachiella ulvae TaxID=2980104 RepID=A0ABT3CQK7_9BACT|nr:tetratricopeptide repeat protein [Reichenbachiella ulvae]MCV9385804.1 tetratricopeptide repeat protein [Reichenbachiella ulvae]
MQPNPLPNRTKDSTAKTISEIDSMLEYAQEARVSNVQLAINIASEAREYAIQLEYLQGQAKSSCLLGLFYMITAKHDLATNFAHKAKELFEAIDDQKGIAETYYILGSVAYKSARHHEGLEYLYDGLRILQQLEDLPGQSRVLKAIGYIYESFQEYEKAEEIYHQSQSISKEIGDKNGESNACNSLSALYLRKGDIQHAQELIDRSIKLKKETGDKRGLAFAYYGKGKIHFHQKQFELALDYISQSLNKHKYVGEYLGAAMCHAKLGKIFFELDDLDKSLKCIEESLQCGEKLNNDEVRYHAFEYLYKISKKKGELVKALYYHEQFHECKSRVINSGTKSRIKSLESMWRMETLERDAKAQKEKADFTERKNQELRRFVSRVSHDLKGPLTSMIELNKVVKAEIKEENALFYFDMYHRGLKRLNETILDLLELTKLNSRELQFTEINFQDLITECLDSFHYYPNFNDIDFQLHIEENLKVLSDKGLINTVVQNLLENGIKYSKHGISDAYVKVSVRSMSEDYFAIIVEDNGIGIGEAYQEKVFDMFYRANDEVDGSGLGLFLLKSAIIKLEGDVKLESEEGVGTKIIVIIPVIPKSDN